MSLSLSQSEQGMLLRAFLRVLLVCGTPMPRRLFVRLNGRADGGVVVSIGDNTTEEEFLQKATARLFRGQPDHVDPSGYLRRKDLL